MLDGMNRKDIKKEIHAGNLFGVKTNSNEDKIFNYIFSRLADYPDELKESILSDNLSDAKMANLVSIMQYDHLFREFVFDVYSEHKQRHNPITDYDVMSFFEKKAMESDTVAGWKYITVFKLRRLYTRILFEAGFLKTSSGEREIATPFISSNLLELLTNYGYYDYIESTVG